MGGRSAQKPWSVCRGRRALIAINILSWKGDFWAAWPLLALAVARAMAWARSQKHDRRAHRSIDGRGSRHRQVNLLSWHGTFWAIWPLLALAIAAGVRWVSRS